MKIIVKQVRVLDPESKRDEILDVAIEGKRILKIGRDLPITDGRVIDGKGKWLVPGLIDVHVHLREPGFEYKETFVTGSRSGAMGGFTTLAYMPNTSPVIDHPEMVAALVNKGRREGLINLYPVGAMTLSQQGQTLGDYRGMKKAGAVALSEDGKSVLNSGLMKKALLKAKKEDLAVLVHCEDPALAGGGAMNEGKKSRELGINGIPNSAEDVITARDLILSRETGGRVHLCHMSTKGSVELLRQAKKYTSAVSGEVSPHHFTLTEEIIDGTDTSTKMNPPLRREQDRLELIKGLQEDVIEIIATDHAPHSREDKNQPYQQAPFGIVGLETALSIGLTELVHTGILSPIKFFEKLTINPAKLLGIPRGKLQEGEAADMTLIDPEAAYEICPENFQSKSQNTPFTGRSVKGKAVLTMVSGKIIMEKGLIKEDMQ
jgi:dihydroorotase